MKNENRHSKESKERLKGDTGIFVRIGIAVLLAGGAIGLFLLQRPAVLQQPTGRTATGDWRMSLPSIDHEIDTMLAHYGIEKGWMKKKQYPVPEANIFRVERKIEIPLDIVPVEVNQEVNAMAHKYSARAIASENTKEHLVTIHIELNGYIIQTIVLHPNAASKRKDSAPVQQVKT